MPRRLVQLCCAPRIGALIFALALLASGCSQHAKLAPLPADAVLLAFGDSLTYGIGANEAESYPEQLARLTGRRVLRECAP